jgi:hypothetical protein
MDNTAIAQQPEKLPLLIERAAAALAKATTPAEFLEARDQAAFVYDAAKVAARFAKAKQAHDEILAACRKAQGDALLIEARAQMRLADEYDAAQARGEAAKHSGGNPKIVPNKNDLPKTAADLGLDRKVILEARQVRDAEKAKPGIVEQTLAAASEPTRARLKRAVDGVLQPQRPTAQAESAPRLYIPRMAEPNNAAERCDVSASYTKREYRAYLIGYRKAAEILADIFEGIAEYEKKSNTPESNIRADALMGSAAAARAIEKNANDLMEEDEEGGEEHEDEAMEETEANEQERG